MKTVLLAEVTSKFKKKYYIYIYIYIWHTKWQLKSWNLVALICSMFFFSFSHVFEVSLYVTLGAYTVWRQILRRCRQNVIWLVVAFFSAEKEIWERETERKERDRVSDTRLFSECHPLSVPRSATVPCQHPVATATRLRTNVPNTVRARVPSLWVPVPVFVKPC